MIYAPKEGFGRTARLQSMEDVDLVDFSWFGGGRLNACDNAVDRHVRTRPGRPKTRSGKILRRMPRKIACGETQDLGDTSTLAEPAVLDELLPQQTQPQSRRR
jgi:hypothetical protein